MKKLIFAILTLAMSCVAINAQNNIFNNPDNKSYFGVRLGVYMTCPTAVTSTDGTVLDELLMPDGKQKAAVFNPGPGVEFGGVFNVPLYANLYIEPGIKLFFEKYTVKKEAYNVYFDNAKITKCGLHIPLMVGYHFDFNKNMKVSIFTGPELETGFYSKLSMDWSKANKNFTVNLYDNDEGMRHVCLLWTIGAGISYKNFQATLSGNLGTQDISKDPDDKYRENHVTLGLGLNF